MVSVVFVTLGLFLTGCGGGQHKISITLPAQLPGVTAPPLENSTISVQLSSSLSQLAGQLESSIPRYPPWPLTEDPGHSCIQWGVYRAQPITVNGIGNALTATTTVDYRGGNRCGVAGVGYASCGYDSDPTKHATIIVSADLTWDPRWYLDAKTQIKVNMDDACTVTFANINVNNMILSHILPAVNNFNSQLPGKLANVSNIQTKASSLWNTLNAPISAGPNAWLIVHPVSFEASNPNVSGNNLSLSAGLVAQPELVIDLKTPPTVVSALPPLQTAAPTNKFHIALNGFISWDSATDILKKSMLNKEYSGGLLKHIVIKDVNVLGNGNMVLVELKLEGDINGTIFITGDPKFDAATELVQVPNLDYALETRNVLATVGDWLLHSKLRDDLVSKSQFQLTTRIGDLRAKLQSVLNQNLSAQVNLNGNVENVSFRGVFLENSGITAQAVADGTANLTLH
jgi:hypothetical protein